MAAPAVEIIDWPDGPFDWFHVETGFHSLWGRGLDDLWLAGGRRSSDGISVEPLLARFDGTTWHRESYSVFAFSNALDITGDSDQIVAVGRCHPFGQASCPEIQSLIYSRSPSGDWSHTLSDSTVLTAVATVAENDFVAVGAGFVVRGDGTAFQETNVALELSTPLILHDVAVLEDGKIVAVGASAFSDNSPEERAVFFDGMEWSLIGSGLETGTLRSVSANGGRVLATGDAGAVYEFDTTNRLWAKRDLGLTEMIPGSVITDDGHVLVLGFEGVGAAADSQGWRVLSDVPVIPTTSGELHRLGVAQVGDQVFALGQAEIFRFSDTAFARNIPSGFDAELDEDVRAVWRSPLGVIFVGAGDRILVEDGEGRQFFDGQAAFRYLWGRTASDVFAIGQGVLQHFDGATWSPRCASETADSTLRTLTGSPSEVFVGGNGGFVLAFDGAQCTLLPIQTEQAIRGLAGASSSDLYSLDSAGVVRHYDGSGWTVEFELGSTGTWMWKAPTGELWLSGRLGRVAVKKGGAWFHQDSFVSSDLRQITGTSSTDVWAIGPSGLVIHFDGDSWSPVDLGFDALSRVWATGDRVLFGGPGQYSELLRFKPWWTIDSL
jgi:hypothetical protein